MTPKFLLKSLPAALLALGVASGAWAQNTPAPASPQAQSPSPDTANSARTLPGKSAKLSHAERKFIEDAAQGGMAEVELGNVAVRQSSNAQVKEFATRMVADHSRANEAMRRLAQEKGVTLPASLSRSDDHEMGKLSKLSGANFDREYMDRMVKDHQKDVKEFEKQASGAKDPDVKAFAAKTLPTLQEHLRLAVTADQTVGGKEATKTSSR